jgi:hypothetical protein
MDMDVAKQLVDSFARMVRMDGGTLTILSVEGRNILLGYTPGADVECTTGACVLPHVELQEMMREWLSRRDPGANVSVQLVRKADP